ncbi:MAG: photosynthetic protein synthase I [Planctomycetes bacterium]|nr:photosynthetic protein synthase I [Planctomycetota bacterium]
MKWTPLTALFTLCALALAAAAQEMELGPLPAGPAAPNLARVELGELLFFDKRLGGDATISCADCHDPDRAWTDGLALSKGYPGSLYFRNTPSLANVANRKWLYWDGRLPGNDLPTMVRDHLSEAHFMQADGRLLIERMRQVPEYERRFRDASGGEPSYGRILDAVSAFVTTLVSTDVPFDRYLRGEENALDESATRGLALFRGKARCANCHNGPMLTSESFVALGTPTNADIFATPERHITFRRFTKTLGVSAYASLREDPGRESVTQNDKDRGGFRVPSLWEVGRTAPYMHDGGLATLADVVGFYDAKWDLGLAPDEKNDLMAFLDSLSSPAPPPYARPKVPDYQLRKLGEN